MKTAFGILFSLSSFLAAQDNVLLIVADDVGVDSIGAYREGAAPPPTPNIDAIAKNGVLFRNAYANPICSPTRAAFHTGRYCFRTGVGAVVSFGRGVPLALSEHTLPEIVGRAGYVPALFGKWHLGDARNGGDRGPNLAGWSRYAGHTWNIKAPQTYYSWRKVVDGVVTTSRVYATSDNVSDAIAWIAKQTKPWFCCICFNTAHAPFHAPPASLHTRNLTGKNPRLQPIPFYKAMVEAMDTEIGRLLRALGPVLAKTNVVFVGDNGTPPPVSEPPFVRTHAKTTLYEGGVNVPLVVAGPAVRSPGREVGALVDSVDLFPTVAELCGVDARKAVPASMPLDGRSFVPYLRSATQKPLRQYSYSERFGGANNQAQDGHAIRNDRYKLIVRASGRQLYDLAQDPFEKADLLRRTLSSVEKANLDALTLAVQRLRADWLPFGNGCRGSTAAPELALVNFNLPRLGRVFATELTGLAANASAAAGLFGLSNRRFGQLNLPLDLTPLGLPGCHLRVGVNFIAPLAIAGGRARWSFALPNDPVLEGGVFYEQGLVLEPRANPAGAIVTGAGAATIGR